MIWVVIITLLIILVAYNLYSGINVKKIGIPGMFMIEFESLLPTIISNGGGDIKNVDLHTKEEESPINIQGGSIIDTKATTIGPKSPISIKGTGSIGTKAITRGDYSPIIIKGGSSIFPGENITTKQDSRDMVLQVQAYLVILGFNPGPIDGIVGQKTRAAIKKFQRSAGVKVDGEVSGSLLLRLKKASLQ